MAATVIAEDDCTRAVITKPVRRPSSRVCVQRVRIRSRVLPAASFSPSVSIDMPSKKSPSPPSRWMRTE